MEIVLLLLFNVSMIRLLYMGIYYSLEVSEPKKPSLMFTVAAFLLAGVIGDVALLGSILF